MGLNVLRCPAEILGTIPVWWINELSIYIGARTQRWRCGCFDVFFLCVCVVLEGRGGGPEQ